MKLVVRASLYLLGSKRGACEYLVSLGWLYIGYFVYVRGQCVN